MDLVPGEIDGGFSRIVTSGESIEAGDDVNVVPLDGLLSFAGKCLAGMQRTLRLTKCIVQIESFETRDQVDSTVAEIGYDLALAFSEFRIRTAKLRAAR